MSFAHDPFRLEPVRANVLQEPQIHKEIYSLEKHIEQLSLSIHESRQRLSTKQQQRATVPSSNTVSNIARLPPSSHASQHQQQQQQQQQQQDELMEEQHSYKQGSKDDANIASQYEQQASKQPQARRRVKTSEYYTTMGTLPRRFEEPGIWKYKVKQQNPMYTTTSNQYGQMPPTVHDMPTVFRGQTSKFTEHLNMAGPYRNFSLNI